MNSENGEGTSFYRSEWDRMALRKPSDLELSDREFERLLALCDVLDEVQLLRLQCKVAALIGDPPQWQVPDLPRVSLRDTVPPPVGLGGPYMPPAETSDAYEELDITWEDESDGV